MAYVYSKSGGDIRSLCSCELISYYLYFWKQVSSAICGIFITHEMLNRAGRIFYVESRTPLIVDRNLEPIKAHATSSDNKRNISCVFYCNTSDSIIHYFGCVYISMGLRLLQNDALGLLSLILED